MLYLKRSFVQNKPIGTETVFRFKSTDIEQYPDWWLVVSADDIDLCVKDPGKDVDRFFTTNAKTMADIWMGDTTYRKARKEGSLKIVGDRNIMRNIAAWTADNMFADLPSAIEI